VAVGQSDPNSRSTIAQVATGIALGGGIVKGLVFDRPRIAAAFPNARAQGQLRKWGVELLTGYATHDIVPITGGTIKVGSKVLTTNAWKRAYQASNALSLAIVGVNMLYGIPNLVDGIRKAGGIEGVTESRAGRTGVLASLAGLVELGLFGYAFARSGGSAGSRLVGAMQHPIHSTGGVVLGKLALSVPIMVNEAGFLDFLNEGSDHDWLENAKATVSGHYESARDILGLD
jgi:hypothetical protein